MMERYIPPRFCINIIIKYFFFAKGVKRGQKILDLPEEEIDITSEWQTLKNGD